MERAEVWYARTATALQFVFICHDRSPHLIRTYLSRRENLLKDNTVSVLLDPPEDRRRGVLFTVNPTGVRPMRCGLRTLHLTCRRSWQPNRLRCDRLHPMTGSADRSLGHKDAVSTHHTAT